MKKAFFILILFAVGAFFIYKNNKKVQLQNNWHHKEASIPFKSHYPQALLNDYFNNGYDVKLDSSNILKEETRQSFVEALETTVSITKKKLESELVLDQNPMSIFLKELFKKFDSKDIKQGQFHIELIFSNSKRSDFSDLKERNIFPDFDNTNRLLPLLLSSDSSTIDFIDNTGNEEATYTNIGALILLKINRNVTPTQINITWRRFFKVNDNWTPKLTLNSLGKTIVGSWKKAASPKFVTVDIKESVHSKDFSFQSKRIIFAYGFLNQVQKLNSFIFEIFPKKEQAFSPKVEISKLIFDIKNKNFLSTSEIASYGLRFNDNVKEQREFKKNILRSLHTNESHRFIKALELKRFHPIFNEVSNQ